MLLQKGERRRLLFRAFTKELSGEVASHPLSFLATQLSTCSQVASHLEQ
jgi:hypothetical protein